MGKRQIGELEPSEFVVTIIISEVAAVPIQDSSAPLASSILAIVLLFILEIGISFIAYKKRSFRKLLYGTPSILYSKGKINQKEMEKQRFSVNDLMEIVRNNGTSSLSDVDYIIVETNGNVSVLMKGEQKGVTVEDMGMKTKETELCYIIVENGKINENNLKKLGFDEKWLHKEMRKKNISKVRDIYCMGADMGKNVFIVKKENKQ